MDIVFSNKDLITKIALHIEIQYLWSFCLLNKRFYNLTFNNNVFWINKLQEDWKLTNEITDRFIDGGALDQYKILYKRKQKYQNFDRFSWESIRESDFIGVVAALNMGANPFYKPEVVFVYPLTLAIRNKNIDIAYHISKMLKDEPEINLCMDDLYDDCFHEWWTSNNDIYWKIFDIIFPHLYDCIYIEKSFWQKILTHLNPNSQEDIKRYEEIKCVINKLNK